MSLVREFGDVRELEDPSWQTHYIIDCIGTDGGLALLTGQRECVQSYLRLSLSGNTVADNGYFAEAPSPLSKRRCKATGASNKFYRMDTRTSCGARQ